MLPLQFGNNISRRDYEMRDTKGVSIIEIMIAVTIITVGLAAILSLASFSLVVSDITKQTTQANILAQETMEAARNYRDGIGWNDDDPGNEYDGLGVVTIPGTYHFEKSSDSPPRWKLVSGAETINGFTKQIVFENVQRDINTDDIVESGGVDDVDTKKVTVTVSWQERTRSHEVEIVTYLTNWNQ